MKNLKLYITVIALLSLAACKKSYLDTEDVATVSEQNYYKTTDDASKALVGVYDGLQRIWSGVISLPVAAEAMSDNAFGGAGTGDDKSFQMMNEFDKTRSPASQNLFGGPWGNYYKAVFRANLLLSHMDKIDWTAKDSLRKSIEAEARFVRAYCYFDMVRLWGNIPLVTKPTSENVPQANPDSVYKLIADDLKFAAANLPSTKYSASWASTNDGKVTKWAAESLIGRVFLYYTGYYNKPDLVGAVSKTQALAYLEDVIANGGFDLISNFAHLWPAASVNNYVGEGNKETIFAIKYTYTSNYNGNMDGNHWLVMNGMRGTNRAPYGQGWGANTINPKLWAAFDVNDTRRNASIISIANEGIPFQDQTQMEYTGYYLKKYTPMADATGKSLAEKMGGANFQIGQYQDYVSIRYADVLLMAAELGSGNKQAYFDKVRQRAWGANFTQIPVDQASIMNERRLEFAGEGIRYYDLLRQGINVAASAIAESATVLNGGASAVVTISAAKIIETKGLVQIPNSQITLTNGVLKQNAGW